MAQYQSGDPTQSPTDNPVPRKDEYGNPIRTGATTGHGVHDVTGTGAEAGQGGVTNLTRSGSSGSSSSEDDGSGGRRKKGMKEKIKEKLPGGHKTDDPNSTAPTTAPYGGQNQDKGVMNKIKENIPGGQKQDPNRTAHQTKATPGYGDPGEHHENQGMLDQIKQKLPGDHKEDSYTTTTVAPPHNGTTTAEQHEKKGVMDKIKEKLPGGNTTTR